MKNYYFLETVKIKEKFRIRVVAGQKLTDGSLLDPTLNVSCSKDLRESNPVGTIFVAKFIKKTTRGFYSASGIEILKSDMKDAITDYELLTRKKFIAPADDSLLSKISLDPTLKAPSSSVDGFYMGNDTWKILIRNIKKHVNTLIIGPTGCGKTSCVREVCNRLKLPLHIFDMGTMIDPISSLLGVHRLEKGGSIFDFAEFTKAIQKPGVILLDELNRSSIGANNILFPCLDDRRKLSIEIACGKDTRVIDVNPEVTFIATANIGVEYSGTNTMDRALVNRFFPIELGNIPSAEETKVLIKRTGITSETAGLIVKIANNIRSLSDKQEVSESLSIRETLMVSSLISDGWDISKSMEMIYLPLFEGTNEEGERSTVYKTIMSY